MLDSSVNIFDQQPKIMKNSVTDIPVRNIKIARMKVNLSITSTKGDYVRLEGRAKSAKHIHTHTPNNNNIYTIPIPSI